jgi:hypothetical protein
MKPPDLHYRHPFPAEIISHTEIDGVAACSMMESGYGTPPQNTRGDPEALEAAGRSGGRRKHNADGHASLFAPACHLTISPHVRDTAYFCITFPRSGTCGSFVQCGQ